MVGHTQLICLQIAVRDRVGDILVKVVPPGVCGTFNKLSDIKTIPSVGDIPLQEVLLI